MFEHILLVCTGNICRSAMAEGLLRELLAGRHDGVRVESAGTAALLGHPADVNACDLLAARGIDLHGHRARQATPQVLRAADLILAMQRHHLDEIYRVDPTTRGKTFLLGHWAGQREIADPYQRGRKAFETTLNDLDRALADWLPKL